MRINDFNEILEKYNWLDIVFGTHNIHALSLIHI